MKRQRSDFANPQAPSDAHYDLVDDWSLIEASLTKQYGIRIRLEADSMSYSEFTSLLTGLMHDTPLGSVVSVRAETDPKNIKNFTPEQRRIHKEWQARKIEKMKESPELLEQQFTGLQDMIANMFG